MKPRIFALLFSITLCSALASAPAASAPPTKADIAELVAAAATYQPGQSREPFRRFEEWLRQPDPGARKELEAGLVQLLAPTSTYEAHKFACTQLGIIGSKTALPALAGLLQSDETAGIACLALTTYPPGKADQILRTALGSARGVARIQVINTLGDRRDSKAVKMLAPLARDTDLAVAQVSIVALSKIASPAAWKVIAALPQGADPALQPVITEATLRHAEACAASGDAKAAIALYERLLPPPQPDYIRRASFEALLRLDQAQAQERVLSVLHGADSALKPAAIAYVRALPARNTSEVFGAELPKLPAQEQLWLIDSLAARGDVAACAAIGNRLESPDAAVRLAAIGALSRVGDTWCVVLFERALDRAKAAGERGALEAALISLPGGARTDQAIASALKESSGATRASFITAYARRQGSAANTLLLAEAGQPDPAAAKAALRALARTATDKDVAPLLERLTVARDAEVRAEAEDAAAQAIPRITDPSRRSFLVRQALGWAQNDDSRIALLGLLPACGDAAALAALKAAADQSDTDIRYAAVRALADWPDDAAWDTLAGIYLQPGGEALSALALRGLVRLAGEANGHADAKLVERYRQLIDGAHTDAELRLILGALGGAAQPGALELALPLLDRAGVHAEAQVAVEKIAKAITAKHPQAAQAALNRLQQKAKAE